eukprot:gb/GECG01002141.1/.p1 GENE.gb/GECG01002141.1/~~gb/GECG01002141.1/.p1  ORF type:complete len:427 (+),score=13.85 gb/GECG01002141.1/:1-1281(+)
MREADPGPLRLSRYDLPFRNVCVTCNALVDSVYKEYSRGNIRLSRCSACGCIVDKYIEFEIILVLIDLALLKVQAYRHVIFNRLSRRSNSISWLLILMLLTIASTVYAKLYLYAIDDTYGYNTLTAPEYWIHRVWSTRGIYRHILLHLISTIIEGSGFLLGTLAGAVFILSARREIPTLPNVELAVNKALDDSHMGSLSYLLYDWLSRSLKVGGRPRRIDHIRQVTGRNRSRSAPETERKISHASRLPDHCSHRRRSFPVSHSVCNTQELCKDDTVVAAPRAQGRLCGWRAQKNMLAMQSEVTLVDSSPELASADKGVGTRVSQMELNAWIRRHKQPFVFCILIALLISAFPRNLILLTVIWPYPSFFPSLLSTLTTTANVLAIRALMRWSIPLAVVTVMSGCLARFIVFVLLQCLELQPLNAVYY